MVDLTDSKLHVRLRFATGYCNGGVEIQIASGVATDLKVLLLAGIVLIGPDTRERRAGGCTVNLGVDTGRGDFACIQRPQTIDQVTVISCIV